LAIRRRYNGDRAAASLWHADVDIPVLEQGDHTQEAIIGIVEAKAAIFPSMSFFCARSGPSRGGRQIDPPIGLFPARARLA
jgi:hypothetical protein